MKKIALSFFLMACQLLCALPLCDRALNQQALGQLMQGLDIPYEDLNLEMQTRFLRISGQERWEMQELATEKRAFVLAWAQEQGLYTAWAPADTHYDHALVLGATTGIMQLRLQYLAKLWEDGVRFHEIFFLTGDRPLNPKVDRFINECQNESEAARLIWERAEIPEEMRSLPVHFIAVAMKTENDTPKRPNTEDTVRAYFAKLDKPYKALFISDQPFCGYQFAVIKSVLPEDFTFDVAGGVPCADPTKHPQGAAITLDSVARWFYQEQLYNNQLRSK